MTRSRDTAIEHTARRDLTDTFDDVGPGHHRSRPDISRVGLDVGLTIGDLGRACGASGQRAAGFGRGACQADGSR